MPTLYNLPELAAAAGVSAEQLRELETVVRTQYGSDEMLTELRVMRTLTAIRDGTVSLSDALVEFGDASDILHLGEFLASQEITDVERDRLREFVENSLSRRERFVLALRYYEHCDFGTLARMLGLSEEQVHEMHQDILERLRRTLGAPTIARVFRVAS